MRSSPMSISHNTIDSSRSATARLFPYRTHHSAFRPIKSDSQPPALQVRFLPFALIGSSQWHADVQTPPHCTLQSQMTTKKRATTPARYIETRRNSLAPLPSANWRKTKQKVVASIAQPSASSFPKVGAQPYEGKRLVTPRTKLGDPFCWAN